MKTIAALAFLALTLPLASLCAKDVFVMDSFQLEAGYRGKSFGSMPAVTLKKRADDVILRIELSNDKNDPQERNREMQETVAKFAEAAEANPAIRVHSGTVDLSTRKGKSSWIGLSSNKQSSRATIYLLGALGEESDVFEVTAAMKAFVDSIELVGETEAWTGDTGLSIKDPERYREELLKKIAADIHRVRSILGGSQEIEIENIDEPIMLTTVSEDEIELYIDYDYEILMRSSAGGE